MNHFAKIAEKLNTYGLDGMLLTCEANRFYASGFHSTGTDGVALVTREGNFYFTDSRYIEAAHNKVQNAEIAQTLYMAEGTVKTHIGRLLSKLDCRDRVGLVLLAHEVGLVR